MRSPPTCSIARPTASSKADTASAPGGGPYRRHLLFMCEAMLGCMGREARFGNPASSSHAYGQAARRAVEEARQQVATLVGSPATALVWTSGATESNDLALKGIATSAGARRHIVGSRRRSVGLAARFPQWFSPAAGTAQNPLASDDGRQTRNLLHRQMMEELRRRAHAHAVRC